MVNNKQALVLISKKLSMLRKQILNKTNQIIKLIVTSYLRILGSFFPDSHVLL